MYVLREQLTKSLLGGQAFITYKRAFEGIKPGLWNVKPSESLHTVYQVLEHMRIAQEDLLYYAIEEEWDSPEWPEDFWPKPDFRASEADWNKTVSGFFRDLEKAVELVNDSEVDLLSVIPGSTEYTYLREIIIIIEHNAYHLGKILDIRKALNNWS